MTSESVFDIAIIGGGVVGCAMARRFTLGGAKTVLIEAGPDILNGASKANSAILHTGFDAPTGSLEHQCVAEGYREYMRIHESLGLPVLKTGAFVVAWNDEQEAQLEGILSKAHKNSVPDAKRISRSELRAQEPNIADHAQAAVAIGQEYVIDPWSAAYAYIVQHVAHGGALMLNTKVSGADFQGDWRIDTTQGPVRARRVINCAGLYGDHLDAAVFGKAGFTIKPRKGQFVVFDKMAADVVKAIILPVPTARTKGIVVCRTIFGNLLVGPTAEEQDSRADASTDQQTLQMLVADARRKFPALENVQVNAIYAGLRPASDQPEYRVFERENGWVTVGGIRSTGLTASLGLAKHVFDLMQGQDWQEPREIHLPEVPKLAEHLPRDWQQPGHGGIVCQCELVTEREVLAALNGPLPVQSWAGLKRRTRVGMGRCQGFYCMGRVAEMTEGKFDVPVAEDLTHDA